MIIYMGKPMNRKIIEISILFGIVLIYSWVFFTYLTALPNASDPLQYVEPAVNKSLVGTFPWIDRLVIADSIRFLSIFINKAEIAGAAYFGIINYLILITTIVWSYLKRGYWTAFLTGFFLMISYPLLRYANYGYSDATLALFALLALIFYLRQKKAFSMKGIFWAGIFTGLALFSKITALAILLFFIIDLVRSKDIKGLKYYFSGLIIASGFILIATILLFNFESIKYVFSGILYNISSNTEPRSIKDSVLTIFSPEIFLPGYLALIVFYRAYKDFEIRKMFLLSISYIIFFVGLVIVSSHIKITPHYLYPAYILASVGMTWFLASLWRNKDLNKSQKYLYLYSLIALILAVLGFRLGISNSEHLVSLMTAPLYLKFIYIILNLAIIALMVAIGIYLSHKLVIIFLILMAFWGSFYTIGSVYRVVGKQTNKTEIIYNFAMALNKVPAEKIIAFTKTDDDQFERRVLWVNRLFYHLEEKNIDQDNLIFITEDQISQNKGGYLLTDQRDILKNIIPEAQIKEEVGSRNKVYVFQL